jgi:hypothetical protein
VRLLLYHHELPALNKRYQGECKPAAAVTADAAAAAAAYLVQHVCRHAAVTTFMLDSAYVPPQA